MFESKDAMRIADIVRKSKGVATKALALAQQMANAITKVDKAHRRAMAATAVGQHALAAVFFVRFGQLGGR